MNWVDKLSVRTWSILVIGMLAFAISGCEGDDGAPGATGPAGPAGPPGPEGPPGPVPDDVTAAIDNADAESCSTCHSGAGDAHQAVYDQYTDASVYVLTIDDVQSVAAGAGWDLTIDFSIDYNGAPLIDPVGTAPSAQTLSFAPTKYDGGAVEFQQPGFSPFPGIDASGAVSNGDGTYTLVVNVEYDIDSWTGGAIVGRIANGDLEFPDGPTAHFGVYQNLTHSAFEFGTLDTWESPANVEGCEACHGTPYRKHGNIEASVAGAPDFVRCKSCHFDDRVGGHPEWQYMVDDPFNWATGVASTGDYDYVADLMNDTHMSHAMEFPYPQPISTCVTCHEGKLTQILDDANFTAETCKSCHVADGVDAKPGETYYQSHRPPPMAWLWTEAGVESFHNYGLNCTQCHGTAGFSGFADLHTGYDKTIYDASGNRYSDTYQVSVDSVAVNGDLITVDFSATDATIVPTLAISFYGWDSKHFIVAAHERDGNGIDCPHSSRPGCNIEWSPGSTKPFFTEEAGSVAGDWSVTFDMAQFQAVKTDAIPQLIADGVVKYIEVAVLPELEIGGQEVNLEAVSMSYDLIGTPMDDYFQGLGATVEFDKCEACHDNLSAIVHTGSGRWGDSMQTCKACHATTFPGSHMEMQSRSIDSYVHAIHMFQPFDEDDVYNGNDPVDIARNDLHKGHTLPYFTSLACESCHVAGTYNVPDQSLSMPGAQSASWNISDPNARAIGTIPEYVAGPASRACGSCHRAGLIIADDAGGIASFDAHTDAFGTLEENDANDEIVYGIIDKIMSMFE